MNVYNKYSVNLYMDKVRVNIKEEIRNIRNILDNKIKWENNYL